MLISLSTPSAPPSKPFALPLTLPTPVDSRNGWPSLSNPLRKPGSGRAHVPTLAGKLNLPPCQPTDAKVNSQVPAFASPRLPLGCKGRRHLDGKTGQVLRRSLFTSLELSMDRVARSIERQNGDLIQFWVDDSARRGDADFPFRPIKHGRLQQRRCCGACLAWIPIRGDSPKGRPPGRVDLVGC